MRHLLLLFLFVGTLFAAERPNILFIAVDDLVPTLGAYGDPYAQTPQIDTLASQGTTFLNHHVQWSVCGPSRAALTTSLMPEETGVTGFKAIRHPDFLPDVITLPQHFRNQGYETACSGKFHDNRTVGTPGTPLTNDQFDDGNTVDDPASWSIPWSGGGSGYNPSGRPAVDFANDTDAEFIDHDIMTNGLGLIDAIAAGDKPFFLAVGFKKPHLGFYAPTKYWDLYDSNGDGDYSNDFPLADFDSAPPLNASSFGDSVIVFNNEILGYAPFDTTGLPTETEARELRHGYYACVSFIDDLVGQLLAKLAVTDDPVQAGKKMSETTIVVLWGDHGFYLGEQGRWAKHSNLDRATSAPFILYDPRSPGAGAKTTSPVNTVDIYPTLCELAGLPIPEQPLSNTVTTGRPLRGRSLVPVLENPVASVNGGAINQFNNGGAFGYSYRTDRYRLIEWVNNSNNVLARDLYDYRNDPLERVNVAADPGYAGIVYELSVSMRAEPTTQGMERLQNSSPVAAPASPIRVPRLTTVPAPADHLGLAWPSAHGVTYRVVSNADLGSIWPTVSGQTSLTEGQTDVAITLDKEFFQIELDDNFAPQFSSDPILKADATSGAAYSSQSIASDASDADVADTLTFSKVAGPAWLTVAANGDLGGTPDAGGADEGAAYFTVAAADNHGAVRQAGLQISVVASGGVGGGTTLSFEPVADTYVRQDETGTKDDENFGTSGTVELRLEFGNGNNFGRVAFLRFDVTGVTDTVQSATLYLTPDTTTGKTPAPETDAIAVYDVDNDAWSETTITWNTAQSPGLFDDIAATPTATLNNTGSGEQSVDITSLLTGNGTISIALDELNNSLGRIYSREEGDPAKRPRLEVTF